MVINGSAIEEDNSALPRYFRQHVIGGKEAFVVTARNFDDFHDAMALKMLREIGSTALSDSEAVDQLSTPPSLSSPASVRSTSKSGTMILRLPSSAITPSFFSADIWRLTVSSVRPR